MHYYFSQNLADRVDQTGGTLTTLLKRFDEAALLYDSFSSDNADQKNELKSEILAKKAEAETCLDDYQKLAEVVERYQHNMAAIILPEELNLIVDPATDQLYFSNRDTGRSSYNLPTPHQNRLLTLASAPLGKSGSQLHGCIPPDISYSKFVYADDIQQISPLTHKNLRDEFEDMTRALTFVTSLAAQDLSAERKSNWNKRIADEIRAGKDVSKLIQDLEKNLKDRETRNLKKQESKKRVAAKQAAAKKRMRMDDGDKARMLKKTISSTVVDALKPFYKKRRAKGEIETKEDFKLIAESITTKVFDSQMQKAGGDVDRMKVKEENIIDFVRKSRAPYMNRPWRAKQRAIDRQKESGDDTVNSTTELDQSGEGSQGRISVGSSGRRELNESTEGVSCSERMSSMSTGMSSNVNTPVDDAEASQNSNISSTGRIETDFEAQREAHSRQSELSDFVESSDDAVPSTTQRVNYYTQEEALAGMDDLCSSSELAETEKYCTSPAMKRLKTPDSDGYE